LLLSIRENKNAKSPKDIEKAIDDLIYNQLKRKEMGENGYQVIINKYN
jgi:spore maturation protein CgeB